MNASVKRKDGRQILDSTLDSVATMLTKKINAVKVIYQLVTIKSNFCCKSLGTLECSDIAAIR